jgi:hypothetical protein
LSRADKVAVLQEVFFQLKLKKKKPMVYQKIIKELQKTADPVRASHCQRFFKTGPGEYGEGDVFIGLRVATARFIAEGEFGPVIKIAEILLGDSEDLLHKATGWMLREMGKRDKGLLVDFLEKNIHQMPRTCLRYAIEKLPESERKYFLGFENIKNKII